MGSYNPRFKSSYRCKQCDFSSYSERGLNQHFFRKHNMNAPTELSNVIQMTTAPVQQNVSSTALMMDNASMDKMMRLADFMASGKSTLPAHLRGSPGDCLAVVMQAVSWNMNPYAVAQKTFLINGTLGYEAQLIAAVINNSGVVKDRFNFEWFGDWKKVIGKFAIRKGEKGEFRVPGWQLNDEEGLGIRVSATLRGEAEPRVLELLLAQARVRNSTLWADDPKQQLAYLAQKRWARLYASDVILGVYSPDEFDQPATKDMGPVQVVPTAEQGASDELVTAARHAAAQGKTAFAKFWNSTPKEIRPQLRHIRAELDQTAAAFDAARTVNTSDAQPKTDATSGEVTVTFEQMMQKLDKATSEDGLFIAMDWSSAMDDQSRMAEVEAKFNARLAAQEINTMKIITCDQGSDEWHQARAGCVTASMFVVARSRLKSGPNKGKFTEAAKDYAFRLAIERISGTPLDEGFSTWQMKRGNELEPTARAIHEEVTGLLVDRAGFVTTDDGLFGASADGLIGDKGGSEYKCLVSPERLRDVLLDDDISDFTDQVQGCMWITGREWWHFGLYCPALASIGKDFFLREVARDDDYIETMELDLIEFNSMVCSYRHKLAQLQATPELLKLAA